MPGASAWLGTVGRMRQWGVGPSRMGMYKPLRDSSTVHIMFSLLAMKNICIALRHIGIIPSRHCY